MAVAIGGRAFVGQLLQDMRRGQGASVTADESDAIRQEVADVLMRDWPVANAPLMAATPAELVLLFRWVCFVSDNLPQPIEPLKIYRGQICGAPGMAWTEDLLEARSYAAGWATAGASAVYQATIPPKGVLARFRAHSEVVVDPAFLTNRQAIITFDHFRPVNPFEYSQSLWAMRPLFEAPRI
jgi:hypothetical protein